MNSPEVIIVGAGIAGLSAALLLQYSGLRVTLLESHDKVGGCAGYFTAGQFTFPTGATVLAGLEPGGMHQQVFEIIGALCPQAEVLDGLKVFLPDRTIFIARDLRKWSKERRRLGGNLLGQNLFWKIQESVADASWLALNRHPALPIQNFTDVRRNLSLVHPRLWSLAVAQVPSVEEVMRALNIHRDHAFRALIELGLIITTQSGTKQTPFLNGAAGLDLWRHGAFHLRGGAGELARYMGQLFLERGGHTVFNARAVNVERVGPVWRVDTTYGAYTAPVVAWNGGMQSLHDRMQPFGTSALKIESDVKRSGQQWGAVNLYCAIRDEAIPKNFGLHAQVLADYSAKAGDGLDVFLSLSSKADEAQAPYGFRCLNVSTHTRLSDWQNLDAKSYRVQKREWQTRLLNGVRIALPDFDQESRFVICGTPSTWESYTQRFMGGVGGFPLTRRNSNLRALSGRVAPGLWCIGDSVFPGQGTVAAALSGFNFWREVMAL